jgi:hypothetical protein
MLDPELRDINTKKAFTIFADLTIKYATELFDEAVADVIKKAWTTVKVFKSAAPDKNVPRPML